ncbi:595c04ac-ceb9-4fe6-be0f-97b7e03b94be [Sclerotinia trifoliorum]|uniref:595c04ac-ceb9-4fe6-be0f-97b7e03b94be n=1 Tax=Sclerotinia trifoliorum TaxID=28548 RepID=A0A8H2VN93_9HELO|nr:595c04ac-ceb9-4fe6-be0f-97b7e03b94be [Sclerotinia trifoliorum]
MAKKSGLQPLMLDPNTGRSRGNGTELNIEQSPRSPLSAKSPKSPRSPFKFNTKKSQLLHQAQTQAQAQEQQQQQQQQEEEQGQGQSQRNETSFMQEGDPQITRKDLPFTSGSGSGSGIPTSQTLPSLSSIQSSRASDKVGVKERPSRTGFFSNYKALKSASKFQSSSSSPSDISRQVNVVEDNNMSRDTDRPTMSVEVSSQDTKRSDSGTARSLVSKPVGASSRSDASLASSTNESPQQNSDSNSINNRKNKSKQFSLLGRTRSLRDDQSPAEPSPPKNNYLDPDSSTHQHASSSGSIKTTTPARGDDDMNLREMSTPTNIRQRSQDRQHSRSRDNRGKESTKEHTKDSGRNQSSFSSTFKEAGGHAFFNNIRSQATKGAGVIHKNLFGKGGRISSFAQKESLIDDEHYVLKVINKPLIEQTRLTRISKRLEDSRDKTEFWMPSFPWRAIDYLNYKGSDVEGLYRVPGSGPQVKKWQRKFDEEMDIDLFECDDLYDINIIGSMLKAWLRELPDELLPRAAQDRIARECAGSQKVPQQLVDELSNLSPFKYYLLFAITCHLSLLLAHSEKNKMDFRNLCICFQPCMKMDAFCFKFLVCDWRDCWKGCRTEAGYIEQEYMLFDQMPPGSAGGCSSIAVESHDERNVSSSDSSKPSSVSLEHQGRKHSNEKGRKTSGERNQRRSPDIEKNQRRVPEIEKNQRRSPEIEKNQRRVPEIEKNQRRSPDIEKNQRRVPEIEKNQRRSPDIEKNQRTGPEIEENQRRGPEIDKNQRRSPDIERNQRRSPDSERSQRDNHREVAMSQSNSMNSMDTVSTTLTVVQPNKPRNGDLRPLSPIKPLSPIGF